MSDDWSYAKNLCYHCQRKSHHTSPQNDKEKIVMSVNVKTDVLLKTADSVIAKLTKQKARELMFY